MSEEKKDEVIKLKVIDMLKVFHNTHLEKFLSHKINAILFSEFKPDDIVQTFVQPSGHPGVPGVERKIKAKEKLVVETTQRNDQEHILRIVDKLIKEEEKNG